MRKLICALVVVTVVGVVDLAWAQGPGIIDPVRQVSVNVALCTLNPGKTMADLDTVQQMWLNAADAGEHNGITYQLTPRYVSGPSLFDVIWLDYLPYDQLAQSSEWWDDNAQDVWAALDEVVSCQESLNTNNLRYANDAFPEDGTGFFYWDWCTRLDGVTNAAVAARRDEFFQGLSETGPRGAWSVMYPYFGMRDGNRLGEFAHTVMLPDWMALTAIHEYWATGGWQEAVDFEENVAQCTGPNIYDLTVLNRPRNPWFQ